MTVPPFTIADLKRIMHSAAGVDESADLDSDSLDSLFIDLGYDSLALLETAAVISRELGIGLDDEEVTAVTCPRDLIELVNSAREKAGSESLLGSPRAI
ncbi:acyl carrier protein [Streptomyces sp. 891-h]|uniref:acyl carrier protein n=1 Tax=Streptomyces sp. 891-h TaxID=2720714 RepID=UPI002430159E|nr:acyl carrier protein [Streptomyces sp. 891-h]